MNRPILKIALAVAIVWVVLVSWFIFEQIRFNQNVIDSLTKVMEILENN